MPQFLLSLLLLICAEGTALPVLQLEGSIRNWEELEKQKMAKVIPVMRAPGLPRFASHFSPHYHEEFPFCRVSSLSRIDLQCPPESFLPTPVLSQNPSTLSHMALCPGWALVTLGGLQHLEDKLQLLSIYGVVSPALHYHSGPAFYSLYPQCCHPSLPCHSLLLLHWSFLLSNPKSRGFCVLSLRERQGIT